MYRDFFTNKWIIGCLALLIVVSVGCLIWYRNETAKHRKALDEATEYAREWENDRKTQVNTTSKEWTVPTLEKSLTTTDVDVNDDSPLGETGPNLTGQPQEPENTETVRVSPHGFGPYPDVPEDFYIKPFSWDFFKNDPPIFELMVRVQVKLWKQGIRTTGIASSNGLLYPTIPGTVFVKKSIVDDVEHIEIRGSPSDDLDAIRKSLMEGIVPDGVTVRDLDEARIDPYTFLNLK